MQDPNELNSEDDTAPEILIPDGRDPRASEYLSPRLGALPRKKGCTGLAWLIIFGLVGFMAARTYFKGGPAEDAQQDRLQEIFFEMQARYLIGAGNFLPLNAKELYKEAQVLDHGSWGQRLKFVVLAGELAGAQEALTKVLDVRANMENEANKEPFEVPTDWQRRLAAVLVHLYRDYVAGDYRASSLDAADRQMLRQRLGWFGDLALHPREELLRRPGLAAPAGAGPALALEQPQLDPAERADVLEPALTTFGAIIGAVVSVGFVSFAGFVGLIIFLVMLAQRKLTGGLVCGSNHGGVYAETFALFLFCFVGLSLLLQSIPLDVSPLFKASLVPLGSLLVVGWPVLRGVGWRQVRQDIGWTLGRSPSLEPAMGVACYIIALPLVIVGLALTLLLMALRNQLEVFGFGALAQHQPIHPIIEFIVHGSTTDRLLVFFDACILAPIVEETMFRGVLYRHLREVSRRWTFVGSVLFSGTVVSFVFAVIHPQGLVAVPVLMALAYGFTIAREWRGSLIPSMVGHAINNSLVILFVILVMGG